MSIVGKSTREGKWWYFVDDGIYGLLISELINEPEHKIFTPYVDGPTRICCLAGPTCDGTDVIRDEIELPELEYGDLLVVSKMGSYSWSYSTTFNSIAVPKVVLLD